MTPLRLESLRRKLYRIINQSLESGDMVLRNGLGVPSDEVQRCGCLLGLVAGYGKDRDSYRATAAKRLGISVEEALGLERGFEWRYVDNELSNLGNEIRNNYQETE